MLIVFDSLMGKTERFVRKTGLPFVRITEGLTVNEPFVLVTYTKGHGEVPETTTNFLTVNCENLLAVASSGHINWGEDLFARAGVTIAERYRVPLLHRWTNSGTASDITIFLEGVAKVYGKSIVPRT